MPIIDGLVAYYSLESDGTDSHGSSHLMVNGAPTFVAGRVGDCVDIERENTESLSIDDNAALSMGDIDFTITCWVNIEDKEAMVPTGVILQKTSGGSGEYFLQYNANNDRLRFAVYALAGFNLSATATAETLGSPAPGIWYFVVAIHDSVNDVAKISINDGAFDQSLPHPDGVFDGDGSFSISDAVFGAEWDGLIDEVGIWKRVLTAEEITWLFNGAAGRSYADIVAGIGGGPGAQDVDARIQIAPVGWS